LGQQPAWAEPLVIRAEGVRHAMRGELQRAEAALELALSIPSLDVLPLERGRTLLALGIVQRRARKRSAARGSLGEAVATFDRIGARLWAERARAELGRIGGRPASPRGLTHTEGRAASTRVAGTTKKGTIAWSV